MKIGLFTDAYFPIISGVALSVDILAKGLRKRGHEVYIMTNNHDKAVPMDHVLRLGGHKLPMKAMDEFRVGAISRKKIKEITDLNLDIIHCHSEFTMGHLGRKAARKMGIPVVHTYHTMLEEYVHFISKTLAWPLKVGAKYFSRNFANKADCVIFPTVKVQRAFLRYGFKKGSVIIPTGIELTPFLTGEPDLALRKELGFEDGDFITMFLGRVSREKSLKELIDQFAKIKDKKVKLLMVGDGPDRKDFEEQATKLGIRDRLVFTGMIPPKEVPKYYKLADLFLNYSMSETQGLTYIEALSSGVPILVRYDSNLEGVVEEGVNGYTFNTNEEFQILFKTIYENPKIMTNLKRNAQKGMEKYSSEEYARRIEEVYLSCNLKRSD